MSSKTPAVRTLPARPSLDSLRKQAKALMRKAAGGDAAALARIRTHLPQPAPQLSLRNAQLVLAREYGFAGWSELRTEVATRLGEGLEWAAHKAERAIHDNDVERLKQLIADHPALLAWRDEHGQPLLQATTPYAMDVTDPRREAEFCRPDCAALLIDAGALVTPSVWEALIRPGAAHMMALLNDKKVLPRTLGVLAALGDPDGVRDVLNEPEGRDLDAVNFAFMAACRFKREAVAAMLLERCIALDPKDGPNLGVEIDRWGGLAAFLADMTAHCPSMYLTMEPWPAFVMHQLMVAMHDKNDASAFTRWLDSQPWLLDASHLALQVEIVQQASREEFLRAVLDRDPALLRESSPPPSKALIWALDYGRTNLIPLLTRIWPLPDDLPHAAGVGDLARVKRWFDDKGEPEFGDLARHWRNVRPGAPTTQQVLDVALAWAVLNKRFEVAEFLLAHGADVNTDWSTHEPASILHECAVHGDFEGARFLIDHGIELTIKDHRWNATAAGWAWHAANDRAMAKMLMEAEEARKGG